MTVLNSSQSRHRPRACGPAALAADTGFATSSEHYPTSSTLADLCARAAASGQPADLWPKVTYWKTSMVRPNLFGMTSPSGSERDRACSLPSRRLGVPFSGRWRLCRPVSQSPMLGAWGSAVLIFKPLPKRWSEDDRPFARCSCCCDCGLRCGPCVTGSAGDRAAFRAVAPRRLALRLRSFQSPSSLGVRLGPWV